MLRKLGTRFGDESRALRAERLVRASNAPVIEKEKPDLRPRCHSSERTLAQPSDTSGGLPDGTFGKLRTVFPNERTTYVLLAAIRGAVLLLILYVGGCFTTKISAARAAAILQREEPSWKSVSCHASTNEEWDYTCVILPASGSRFSLDVRVSRTGVTDQSAP